MMTMSTMVVVNDTLFGMSAMMVAAAVPAMVGMALPEGLLVG